MRNVILYAFVSLLFVAVVPRPSSAEPLTIGNLSFDSGVSPSSSTFDIFNFTGGFNSPDGIADSEIFSGTLAVTLASGTTNYTFSGISPLSATAPFTIASVPTGSAVLAATLSLVLSNSSSVNVLDAGGNAAIADLLPVGDIALPLVGSSLDLTACDGSGTSCSTSLITVDSAPPSAVPEPKTIWLLLTSFGAGATLVRHERRFKGVFTTVFP